MDEYNKKKNPVNKSSENKEDDISEENKVEPEIKLNVVTKYVAFDPQFFSEPKKEEKSVLFLNAKSKLNAEIQNSLTVEDFKAAIRRSLGSNRKKPFDLLGARKLLVDEDAHTKRYRDFMSKRVIF